MITYDDWFFDTNVAFSPVDRSSSTTISACVQPAAATNPASSEARRQPDSLQRWQVFTRTSPGAGHHWWAEWDGVARRVEGSTTHDPKAGVWVTNCVEVS